MTDQETYSAKQIAHRIGTDPKTFRKWLRSTASPYEAVGQGARYEFPVTDLEEIRTKFSAWKKSGTLRPINGYKKTDSKLPKSKPFVEFEQKIAELEAARAEVYGDEDEPTREDLETLIENNDLPSDEELEDLEDLDLGDLDED